MAITYNRLIDSDLKCYEEIRKLTTGQVEDYATECLLGYEYIKNHYWLIAVDLSIQKELDANLNLIQQIEFVRNLKKIDGENVNRTQSIFILTILETIETRNQTWLNPLGKVTSWGRPENVFKKRPDVLRTSPYGSACNAKGRICSGKSLQCTQDVNLNIIHQMGFHGIFSSFSDCSCTSDIVLSK